MTQEFDDLQFALRHYWRQYRGRIVGAGVLVLCVWIAGSVFYKVETDSQGVVLRLGEYYDTAPPGLHTKLPWPIDAVYTVPVAKVQAVEFGQQTVTPGRRTQYAPQTEDQRTMARMLTADLNLAHVEWVVRYRIKNAKDYLFKVGGERWTDPPAVNARELISNVSEAVMRRIIGDVSVDSVITIGRERIATDATVQMQQMLDGFESGIKIQAVKLKSATPPDPVKDAFDDVNRAKQNKERIVNDAKGQSNLKIPAARGGRDRVIAESEGYAARVVMEATGRANAFLAKLAEYEKAPEVTRKRLYIETMEQVLSQVSDKIVIDESVRGILPLLQLDAADGGGQAAGPLLSGRRGGAR